MGYSMRKPNFPIATMEAKRYQNSISIMVSKNIYKNQIQYSEKKYLLRVF